MTEKLKPGWFALSPDGAVADDQRFVSHKAIKFAIEGNRLGLRHEWGTLKPRYHTGERWTTEEESRIRIKVEYGLSSGELKITKAGVVCAFCGGNCGQCGNTGLTDVNGPSMDSMIKGLYNSKPRRRSDYGALWPVLGWTAVIIFLMFWGITVFKFLCKVYS